MLDSLAIALQGVGYDSRVLALQGFYPVDVPVVKTGGGGSGRVMWRGSLPRKPTHRKPPVVLVELLPAGIEEEFERPSWLARALREDEEEFF